MQLIVRVFVSSTWLDLQPERAAVEKALQRIRQTKLNGMEYFGSRDETTCEVSLKEVDRSDVYVGIIGGRYGSGITEEEYRRASEKKLPRFLYFKDEETIPSDGRDTEEGKQTRLTTWKEELRKTHALGTGPFTSPDDLAARVTADFSNWLLDQYGTQLYLEGVNALPYDYAGRIENFLTEYLGTSKAPVPFGGREKDLKALDAWLEDPAAPPYLMIAAPAGRGKSALLIRWSRQLLARPNIALVFVPISIRFRTNLSSVTFAALAARLARLHSDKMPDTPSTSVETWRGLVTEYLRRPLTSGEKLLVVLDGLDEAADWEASPDLFPLNPHDQIRVVVSARHRAGDEDARAWLRRLGWERQHLAKLYDLETLNKEGVAQVLNSMGFPLAQLGAKVDIVAELYRLSEGDPLLVRLYVDDLWTHKEMAGSLKPEDLRKLQPGLKGYFDRWWTDQRTLWGKESPLKVQAVQTLLSVLACSLGPLDQEGLRRLTQLSFWDLHEALKPLDRFVIGDGKIHGYAFSHPRLGDYFKDALSASEQQAWQQQFLDWGKDTVQALEQGTLAPDKVPDYLVQYYGTHLEQAHAPAKMLLRLVSQGWSKAWEAYEGSFAGFLNDVERAWKSMERENEQVIAEGEIASRIGDEIRCALVKASINSLAENLPVELLVKLVRHQKWTVTQGLSYARQIPEDDRRTYALVCLATELEIPRDLRDQIFLESLSATESFSESQYLTSILTTLAPHLPEAVLAAIPTLIHSEDRVRILMALAPYQPEAVVAAIPGLTEEWQRAQILIALGPHQPDAVVAALPSLEDIKERATVLIALAPYRSETVLAEAVQIGKSDARAQVLTALAPYRPEEVWAEIPALKDHMDRVKALIALAPHLPKAVLTALPSLVYSEGRVEVMIALAPYEPEAVLAALPNITGSNDRLELLTALAPHKPEAVLAAARELSYGWQRDHVLGALTPHQPETLAAVRAIKDGWKRAQVLTALSTNRPEVIVAALKMVDTTEELVQVLASLAPHHPDAVLRALPTLLYDQDRIPVLTALVPYKPEAVLAIVRRIQDNEEWVTIFSAMTPYQSESVLAAVPMFKDNKDRIRILMALAPHQSQAVLAAVPTLQDSKDRVKILTALAPYQSQEVLAAAPTFKDSNDRIKILTAVASYRTAEVLAAVPEFEYEWQRAQLLVALAPYQSQAVLAAVPTLQDSKDRVKILAALAPYQSQEVLAAVQTLKDSTDRTDILKALAPHKPKAVAETVQVLEFEWQRVHVLSAVAPHMPAQDQDAIFQRALGTAQTLKNSWHYAAVLTSLAPYRPEAVLAAVPALEYKWHCAEVLATVAPYMPAQDQDTIFQRALGTAQTLKNSWHHATVLTSLAPYRPEAVLMAARELDHTNDLIAVLMALAPHRPAAVLASVHALRESGDRAKVLAVLAAHTRSLSRQELYPLWHSLLRHISTSTRKELLCDLAFSLPIIDYLGQKKALLETLPAVQDVITWWP